MNTTMKVTTMRAIAAALLLTVASRGEAQQQLAGPRFQAWLGCWSSASGADALMRLPGEQTLVCITPPTPTW